MNIEKEISKILARNKKVEAEKAWETSMERKALIIIITYVFMLFFMNMIGVNNIFLNALIPTFGFFLSTLSVNFLKDKYIKKYLNN